MRLLLLVLLVGFSRAQDVRALATAEGVAAQIDRANDQVLVVVPTVRAHAIAEALRRAAVERGVRIFIVADSRVIETAASYLPALSHADTVTVRVSRVDATFVLIDRGERAFLIEGRVLAEASFDDRPAYATSDGSTLAERSARFIAAWDSAAPYLSFVERGEFTTP